MYSTCSFCRPRNSNPTRNPSFTWEQLLITPFEITLYLAKNKPTLTGVQTCISFLTRAAKPFWERSNNCPVLFDAVETSLTGIFSMSSSLCKSTLTILEYFLLPRGFSGEYSQSISIPTIEGMLSQVLYDIKTHTKRSLQLQKHNN